MQYNAGVFSAGWLRELTLYLNQLFCPTMMTLTTFLKIVELILRGAMDVKRGPFSKNSKGRQR